MVNNAVFIRDCFRVPDDPPGARGDATSAVRALCGKLRKPPATGVEDARLEDSPSGRLIRPVRTGSRGGMLQRFITRIGGGAHSPDVA